MTQLDHDCQVCGCTWDQPCWTAADTTCGWIAEGLCSECAELAPEFDDVGPDADGEPEAAP